jgi:hypothetical protein
VRREDATWASFVLDSKAEGQQKAEQLAEADDIRIVLHDENGRIQKYYDVEAMS